MKPKKKSFPPILSTQYRNLFLSLDTPLVLDMECLFVLNKFTFIVEHTRVATLIQPSFQIYLF